MGMSSPNVKARPSLDLASELRQAVADIERGDYIELTPKQLESWAETGELPWADESHD